MRREDCEEQGDRDEGRQSHVVLRASDATWTCLLGCKAQLDSRHWRWCRRALHFGVRADDRWFYCGGLIDTLVNAASDRPVAPLRADHMPTCTEVGSARVCAGPACVHDVPVPE